MFAINKIFSSRSLHGWIFFGMRSRLERAFRRTTEGSYQVRHGAFLDGRDRFGVSGRRGLRHARRAPAVRQDRPEGDDDVLGPGSHRRLVVSHLRGRVGTAFRCRKNHDWCLRRHVLRPDTHVHRRDHRETDQRYIIYI